MKSRFLPFFAIFMLFAACQPYNPPNVDVATATAMTANAEELRLDNIALLLEIERLNIIIESLEYSASFDRNRCQDYRSMVRSFLALPQNQAELDWYILNDDFEHYRGDVFAAYLRDRVAGLPPHEDKRCVGKFYSTGEGSLAQMVDRLTGENDPANDEALQQIWDIVRAAWENE